MSDADAATIVDCAIDEVLAQVPVSFDRVERWQARPGHVVCRLSGDRGRWFLKMAESGLEAERLRLDWMRGRLPTPIVVGFGAVDGVEWLLTSEVVGLPLSDAAVGLPPER